MSPPTPVTHRRIDAEAMSPPALSLSQADVRRNPRTIRAFRPEPVEPRPGWQRWATWR
jgi:hypothetical protein